MGKKRRSRSRIFAVLVAGSFAVVGLSVNSGAQQPPPDWRFPSNPVSGWAQVGYIKASNPSEGDQFGFSVALSGDGKTLAVGATQESSGSSGINGNQADDSEFASGAVYVFTRTGIGWGWKQQAYIKATHPRATDQFGFAVALSGDGNTLVVSAPYEKSGATGINGDPTDDSAPESGAVYVFTRDGETWSQQAYVKASNTDESDTSGRHRSTRW